MDRDNYRIVARVSDRRVLVGAASLARNRLNLLTEFLSFLSSTLAITPRSKLRRLAVPQTCAGLLACRCPRTTRKKSPPAPTTPCVPAPKHRRRSGGAYGTTLFVGRRGCRSPYTGEQTAQSAPYSVSRWWRDLPLSPRGSAAVRPSGEAFLSARDTVAGRLVESSVQPQAGDESDRIGQPPAAIEEF
jgi:hypothetical protein